MRPAFTFRQTVAGEHANSASTTGCLTFAESGSESNNLSASGKLLGSDLTAMICVLSRRVEHGARIIQP
jgi:hypothetical protein